MTWIRRLGAQRQGFWLGVALVTLAMDVGARAQLAPQESVLVPVSAVLMPPQGFDDNDTIELVVYGREPEGCAELNELKIVWKTPDGLAPKIPQGVTRLEVELTARRIPESECQSSGLFLSSAARVSSYFTRVVSLGSLRGGDYEAQYRSDAGTISVRRFRVHDAIVSSIDDRQYAEIAAIQPADRAQPHYKLQQLVSIRVDGRVSNTCDRVRLEPARSEAANARWADDVLVFLPVVERVAGSEPCVDREVTFSNVFSLGLASQLGYRLVHIRSRGGGARYLVVRVDSKLMLRDPTPQ